MASTNKTPQLGLNQWAAGDEVLRTDFNGDNLAIEAGLEALKARGSCVTGSYAGDSSGNRTIELGFQPRFLVLLNDNGNSSAVIGLISRDFGCKVSSGGASELGANDVMITKTGFKGLVHFNGPGCTVYYAAFF